MDSDKAAVWVTNWDTERNGSSLTTRDGTSYLLANAFMLAYDYGQPHIFSGYYYAGVDDGAPGATRTSVPDMTCPTDGIETAGTWHCAQRWTAIRGMIGFRNAVAGTFTATVAKGSAVALYAGATPANWAGTGNTIRPIPPGSPAKHRIRAMTPPPSPPIPQRPPSQATPSPERQRPMPSAAPQRSPPSSCPSSSASRSWR